MTSREPDVDPFIDALRSDLPNEHDQRRIRARLLASGVIAAVGMNLPATAAASTAAGTKAGLLPKLMTLSWGAKVGLAGAVVTVAATVPLGARLAAGTAEEAPRVSPARVPSAEVIRAPESPRNESASVVLTVDPGRSGPVPAPRARSLPRAERAPSVPAGVGKRGASPPERPVDAIPDEATPGAVGAFPMVEPQGPAASTSSESTLREESALIEGALIAIRAGDRATARHWLGEHVRRFPRGQLTRERERALRHVSEMNDRGGDRALGR